MYDDKYVDFPHGIPFVSVYFDYFFGKYIPPTLIKVPSQNRLVCTYEHCHSDFEILYFTNGIAEYVINNNTYSISAGDMLLINPYDVHYGTTPADQKNFSYYCIDFDINLISDELFNIFPPDKFRFKNYISAQECINVLPYFENIHHAYTNTYDGWKLNVKGNLCLLFSLLFQNKDYYAENADNNNFTKTVFEYIEENYAKPIGTKDIAKHLSYNPSYFCRCFKQNFSCTFSEFLNIFRIKQAVSLIENGYTKVSELTTMVGFNNFSYFANTFKKHIGILPSEYIKKLKKQNITESEPLDIL